MSTTFRVLIDEIPDALDLEPDLDGVDWLEDEPDLDRCPVHLYVHGVSTSATELSVSASMTLDVRVSNGASSEDWDLAFAVIELALDAADTVLVETEWGEVVTMDELRAHCDDPWRAAQLDSFARELIALDNRVVLPGPVRDTIVGPRVRRELADATEPGPRLLEVIRRVQWIVGPHFAANAIVITAADGTMSSVAVIGPDLRYVLAPVERVLLEHGRELVVPGDVLDRLPGVSVTWLDDGHRLIPAVPEVKWAAVVTAAEPFRIV